MRYCFMFLSNSTVILAGSTLFRPVLPSPRASHWQIAALEYAVL